MQRRPRERRFNCSPDTSCFSSGGGESLCRLLRANPKTSSLMFKAKRLESFFFFFYSSHPDSRLPPLQRRKNIIWPEKKKKNIRRRRKNILFTLDTNTGGLLPCGRGTVAENNPLQPGPRRVGTQTSLWINHGA